MIIASLPLTAHAHANAGWAHSVLDGAMVFGLTIEYLLPVLAAALLPSRVPRQAVGYGVGYLVTGLLLGMVAAYAARDVIVVSLLAQSYLSLLGLVVLLDLRLPLRIVCLLRFLAGGLVGLQFGVSPMGDPLSAPTLTLGFIAAAVSIYTMAALLASYCRVGWQRIAMRIAGSWIVAIAVIYLAYLVRQLR